MDWKSQYCGNVNSPQSDIDLMKLQTKYYQDIFVKIRTLIQKFIWKGKVVE